MWVLGFAGMSVRVWSGAGSFLLLTLLSSLSVHTDLVRDGHCFCCGLSLAVFTCFLWGDLFVVWIVRVGLVGSRSVGVV